MTQERYDSSWLFISTQARHRKSVRPLISLWVSLATLMLQSMGKTATAAYGSLSMKPQPAAHPGAGRDAGGSA
jgi:hypothetical protein